MNGKIVVTIVAGILVAGLIALMWWWFLYRAPVNPTTNGSFSSSDNKPTSSGSTATSNNNVPSPVLGNGGNTGTSGENYSVRGLGDGTYAIDALYGSQILGAGTYTLNVNGVVASYLVTPIGTNGTDTIYTIDPYSVTFNPATTTDLGLGNINTSGVDWLANTGGGTVFNPNTLGGFDTNNPFSVDSIPNIGGSGGSLNGGGGVGLGGALVGAVGAGAVACVLPQLAASIGGSFALALSGQALGSAGAAASGAGVWPVTGGTVGIGIAEKGTGLTTTAVAISSNLSTAIQLNNLIKSQLLDCFARQIAKALLKQIAQSTIQWINNGFNGSPSFVQNYEQFFTNVADDAAGQFIRGSSLAFLCSPFQMQIRIAVAQNYANRNRAQSCTLSSVTRNINSFLNGNFSSGGWSGLLSLTTVPTNNPYGAFAYGSIGINSAASNAQGQRAFDLGISGGFLSITQEQNCRTVSDQNAPVGSGQKLNAIPGNTVGSGFTYQVCDVKNVTPGTAISQALDHTLGINTQELETAQYFDQILSALVSQLIQNVAYKGLSNLSTAANGYVSDSTYGTSGTTAAPILQSILQNIPGLTQAAQSLTLLANQNIAQLQSTLNGAQELRNCWLSVASSTPSGGSFFSTSTIPPYEQAQQGLANVNQTISNLQIQIAQYQNQISRANEGVSSLQNYQGEALSTSDTTALINIMNNLSGQVASGAFAQDTDVVNAQEDQINLRSGLDTTSQSIATDLTQCNALR